MHHPDRLTPPARAALRLMAALLLALPAFLGTVRAAPAAPALDQLPGGEYESERYGYTVEWSHGYWAVDESRTATDGESDTLVLHRSNGAELFIYSAGMPASEDPAEYLEATVLRDVDEDSVVAVDTESDVPAAELIPGDGSLVRGEVHAVDETLVVVYLSAPLTAAGQAIGDARLNITLDGEPLFAGDPIQATADAPEGDATAADAEGADVPTERGGNARTGELPGPGPKEEPETLWTFNVEEDVASSPTIVDGVLYIGGVDGHLYALDAATGQEVWSFDAETDIGGIQTSPAVAGGMVYFGTQGDTIHAVDIESGEEVWSFRAGASVFSSPAVADGILYAGSWDGFLYALDAETGDPIWHYPAGGDIWAAPAVVDGVLYFGIQDGFTDLGAIIALEAETGEELWRVTTEESIAADVAVVDGVVYAAESDVGVHALDAETGEILWTAEIEESVYDPVAVADGVVYAGTYTGTGDPATLHALDAETGDELWTAETVGKVTAPVISDGVVYAGDIEGMVYAFDAESGEELWTFEADGEIGADTVVSDGVLYFGTRGGTVYALGEAGASPSGDEGEDRDQDTDEPGAGTDDEPADGEFLGVDGNTFQSQSYGLSFEWPADWQVVASTSPGAGQDSLTLTNGAGYLFVETYQFEGTPPECVEGTIEGYAEDENYSDIEPALDSNGDEIAGSMVAEAMDAFAAITVTYDAGDGPEEWGIYVGCWTVNVGPDAVARFTLIAPVDELEEQIAELEAILETMRI